MRKIEYKDKAALRSDYLKLFDITAYNREWSNIRSQLIIMTAANDARAKFTNANLPDDFGDLITADFRTLAEIYVRYRKACDVAGTTLLDDKLKNLFDYETKQPMIHHFFIDHKDDIDLSTCHYCEMAYVNSYDDDINTDDDVLRVINTYPGDLLIGICSRAEDKSKMERTVKERYIRPFADIADFEARDSYRFKYSTIKGLILSGLGGKGHFDLDHFLDKGTCRITALSLFNFVPSCQVCNQRLKHTNLPVGLSLQALIDSSPTSDSFAFDSNMKIRVSPEMPVLDYLEHKDDYRLEFRKVGMKDYRDYVRFFKLDQRYQLHKVEALRLMNLKQKYDRMPYIGSIAALVYGANTDVTRKLVREDLFQTYFKDRENRIFAKMYRDIIDG